MIVEQSHAAKALSMIHDKRMSMAWTAKALGVRNLDGGEMLASHKRILEARDLAEALRAGEGRSPAICDMATIETAYRRRVLEKASLLLSRGVESGTFCERLGLADSQVRTLPEARAMVAESDLQRAADRKVQRAAAKLKFGNQRTWTPVNQMHTGLLQEQNCSIPDRRFFVNNL